MNGQTLKIGIVAPGSPLREEAADRVQALAASLFPDHTPDLLFHPQCFDRWGHFAGTDEQRAGALVEYANDETIDAIWFARGGYGACRLLDLTIPNLNGHARRKTFLGYSDAGSLLGALYAAGFRRLAHGPMPTDINREDGEKAVARALQFLVRGDHATLEASVTATTKAVAFNSTILAHLVGTPHLPDLAGHILMLEDVSEYAYRIDRTLWQITSCPAIRTVAGIKLGRFSDIPDNDPDFQQTEEDIATHWCAVSGIPYLGRADIGHDVDNKIVPFGAHVTS